MVNSDQPITIFKKYKNLYMKIKDRSLFSPGVDEVGKEFFDF